MRQKLTNKQAEKAKTKAKEYRLADGQNLYLSIRPNGSRSWLFRYKRPDTEKMANISFGVFPDISIDEARNRAKEAREMLSKGKDPQIEFEMQKFQQVYEQNTTFEFVAEQWKAFKADQVKEKTLKDNWRKLELYVFPKIGHMPVADITAPSAIATLKPTEENGLLETVKRCAQLMNEIMHFAANHGLIYANPLTGISEVFKKPIVKHLSALAPEDINELLKKVSTANIHIITRFLIEWQLHTMVRPQEASGARWDEINLQDKCWLIPASRMKTKRAHKVPLTKQTLAMLQAIKSYSPDSEYIFPSRRDPKVPTDSETANKALGKMDFKNRTTAHGLRALASTTLNNVIENGQLLFKKQVIEAALSHVDKSRIHLAYNRETYFEARAKLMNWWSNHIEKASFGSFSVIDM